MFVLPACDFIRGESAVPIRRHPTVRGHCTFLASIDDRSLKHLKIHLFYAPWTIEITDTITVLITVQ